MALWDKQEVLGPSQKLFLREGNPLGRGGEFQLLCEQEWCLRTS